jgi:hypothetical protein
MYCQDTYSTLSIPAWVKGLFVVLLAITIFMSAQLPSVINIYKVYRSAVRHLSEKEFLPAMSEYFTVLEKHNNNVPIIMDALEAAIGAQQFDAAVYIFNVYLSGKTVDDEQYNRAMYFDNFLEHYYETQNMIEEVLVEHSEDIESIKYALLELLEREAVERASVYYVLGCYC